jgi:hypothetical protein
MLLIQQSVSFRAWTSRALMVYFRRALLFLVVSPRQNIINNHYLLQQQKVYFSDAEDDEETLIVGDKRRLIDLLFDQNEKISNRIQISLSNQHLLKEYVFKKLSQGLNNSMNKSRTENSFLKESLDKSLSNQSSRIFDSVQPPGTEYFEVSVSNSNQGSHSFSIKTVNTKINEKEMLDDSDHSHPLHNQIDTLRTNSVLNYPVSHFYEKDEKAHYIPIYSLVHLVVRYLLFVTYWIIKLRHLNQMNYQYQNLLLNIHQLQSNKISLNHPMMKMIFMKNIKLHFHIFFIKQKASILFEKKISYYRC